MEISLTQEAVRFSVRDEGPGFDPAAVPDPTDPEFLDRPSGRGMLLMRSFMDEVAYSENGRQVTMIKNAPSPAVDIFDGDSSVFDDDDDDSGEIL